MTNLIGDEMIDKLKVLIYEPILKGLVELFATPLLKIIGGIVFIGLVIWVFKRIF